MFPLKTFHLVGDILRWAGQLLKFSPLSNLAGRCLSFKHWGEEFVCRIVSPNNRWEAVGKTFLHISGWELIVEIHNVIIFTYQ